jgi:alpha-glucuronidase
MKVSIGKQKEIPITKLYGQPLARLVGSIFRRHNERYMLVRPEFGRYGLIVLNKGINYTAIDYVNDGNKNSKTVGLKYLKFNRKMAVQFFAYGLDEIVMIKENKFWTI